MSVLLHSGHLRQCDVEIPHLESEPQWRASLEDEQPTSTVVSESIEVDRIWAFLQISVDLTTIYLMNGALELRHHIPSENTILIKQSNRDHTTLRNNVALRQSEV